ncbi:MAG: AMP-binding protein, partial [Hyphomicrobiales bacterium]|nr:AMP-binding protein [Hyphomicrobiales bacterium]
MTSNHLFSFIHEAATLHERPFLETPQGRKLNYGDVLAGSARFAHALAKLGVAPGDRVAVQVEKSPEALLLYLGCVRAGAIFLPLNSAYTTAELEYFIGDAEPSLLVGDPTKLDAFKALAAKAKVRAVETLDAEGKGSLATAAARADAEFEDVPREAADLAAILYTSGTTGRSKGAMLSHANLASNAVTLARYWQFTADDVLLHALPIYHTHGLFVATNTVLFSGASMIFIPKLDPDELLRQMPRATVMMGVPTFYTRLLRHPGLNREATRHMRLFVSGSAPLLAETHREWQERTGHAILERYGMTETNMNTSNPYAGER